MKTFITTFLLLICSCWGATIYAQREGKKLKKVNSFKLSDSLTSYSQSDIFEFPNLYKASYFYNGEQLKKLQLLNDSGIEMYEELKKYVKSFGIENFGKNTPMLWKLAKLSEKFGPKGEAILLYKLILKHHKQGVDIQKVFKKYDSIETDKREYYVPLNFYYELVNYRKEIDTLRPPHAVLVNMGFEINSPKEDYGPTIGNVDNVLLFTSKRNKHAERAYDENIFYTKKEDGYWTEAKEFNTINTGYNEGSACLSSDGKQLFFSRCDAPGSLGNCDLYVAILKKDSTWGDIKNLGPNINSSGWESQPSLSHRGDTLFFASNRIGGFGLSDIYFSTKDSKGNWQKAKNIGPIVNTRFSEVSPFFHHAHQVLYFSSNGHPLNFGEFDIYKSNYRSGQWMEPKNIGPLVNGPGSENYFTIDSKSHDLFYARSSEEDLKNLDLYSFPVPMEAQPEATVALKGSLLNKKGEAEKGIVSIIDLDKGVEVSPKFLRKDGRFDFQLINHRNYLLIIQGDEFFRIEEIFYLDGDKEINKIAEPIESKIAFESLEFENGKANILPSMQSDLSKLGNFLIDHPEVNLRIAGHTDSAGKEEANLKLSQARADAIKEYLVLEFKVNSNRIEAIGYGSSKPIVEELTDEHKQLNRRVEFEIYKQ